MYSGRELFLSDSSLFVDDAEAYDKYQREDESNATVEKVSMFPDMHVALTAWYFLNFTLHLENKPILEQLYDYKKNQQNALMLQRSLYVPIVVQYSRVIH